MKQLKLLFTVLFLAVLGLGNAWAEEVVYKTALFGSAYNSQSVSAYNASWTATNNGFTVNLANWNNNNNGWAYIKAGHKNTAYVGTITTAAAIDKKVTKVVVTIDAITAANVNSIKLYTGASANACTTEIGSFDKSTGAKTVTLTSPTANLFYKVSFDCIAKANGCVQVSKVEYYYDDAEDTPGGGDPEPVASFTVSPTSIDFGSKEQGATVDAQDVTVTLTNTDYAIATLSGTNADAFEIVAGEELTETGVVSVRPTTATLAVAGTYTASLDIEADGVTGAKSVALSLTVTAPEVGVGFEKALTAYSDWEFNAIVSQATDIAAHSGSYCGKTGGNATAYIQTKSKVNPASISCFVSKQTNNTSASNWKIQVSTNKSTWTDVAEQDAKSMNKGTWVEFTADLSIYTNVYVRIYYSGSTAVRNIDDIVLTTRELTKSTVSFAQPAHGTVSASATENVEEGTQVTLTYTPADGYKLTAFDAYKTGDEATKVTVSADGKFTMPAYDVTATATIEVAKSFNGSELTLSGEYPTEFWKGDAFSHDGMTVTAHFNTGDETVTGVFSGYDMTTAGTQTVTVTFTEGGVSQTATYDITVKTIANTQETAYTAAQAKALVDAGNDLSTPVYVKGIVSEIATAWNESYGNISFNVSADGTTNGDQFQFFRNFKGADKAKWTSTDMIPEVGDEVIGYGTVTYFAKNDIYEFAEGNYLVSLNRPVVLQSIELNADNVKKTYKIGVDDEFSAENLVVTAHYNVASNDKTIDLANVSITGYDMTVANTYTVTVSYTENEVTKSATYQIQVKPNCETLATITMGAAENGTFDLSIKGEQCAETAISTVLTAEPAEHYHLASVTATNGTVGAIEGNTCTISDITADAEITAVFEEDAKGTATFVKGNEAATGDAPAAITKYVGETLTIPANTFALLGGYKFIGWKYNETIYQKGDEFTVAGDAEFVAQWEALPVWASTYTSNIDLTKTTGTKLYNTEKVKVNGEATEYPANKMGTSSDAGNVTIKVPAGATALHFHAIAWTGKSNVTLSVKNGEIEIFNHGINANTGLTGSSAYTLVGDPTQDYYCVTFSPALEAETSLVFAASDKRFVIYGVNYVAPASVTLAPASHDFGEVKEGETADFEFTATKNIFATGDVVVTFEGTDAAAFSAGAVDAETGKFTVTFAPTEVRTYNATVKVTVDGAEATATLAGEGISATTPTISTDVETIDFGSVKQEATVAAKTVNVEMEYLAEANVEITGTVFTLDKTALTENGAIVISANTAAMGTYSETLTISGEGATSKTVTVTMTVISKYASEYTSNVTVGGDIVVIGGKNYEAIKKGTGSASQSTTITAPKGTQTLHFHAVAWNNENTVLVVKQGDNTLGSFNLYKDAGVKGNGPSYTLEGDNYDTDQYFFVNVAAYTAEDEAVITFTTTASPYRFVLYGVNQEGGIVPVLDHIAIEGEATALTYEVGDEFNPAGLSVKAYYTMEGVLDESKTKTLAATDFEWSFSPATLAESDVEVVATASFEGKSDDKTITGLTVTVPVPTISVDKTTLAFGTVNLNATVEAKTVAVTLENLAEASVAISGEGAAKFAVDVTNLTESGNVTVSATANEAGEFSATLTISGEGAESKTVALSMTVVDPSSVTEEEATLNEGYTNGQAATTYSGSTLTITYAKGEGSTAPAYYTTGNAIRIYSGNTVTITATKNIYMVEVAYSGDDYANLAETTVGNNNHGYVVCDGTSTTVTLNNTSTSQSRITGITVYYEDQKEEVRAGLSLGKFGTICVEKMTLAPKGATFYTLNYYDEAAQTLYVKENKSGRLEAGVPYIYEAEGANIDGIVVANEEAAKEDNGFHAVLGADKVITAAEAEAAHIYGIVNNTVRPAAEGATIKAGRCYIQIDEVADHAAGAAPARAFRVISGTNNATGLEGLEAIEGAVKVLHNGQIVILRDGKIYSVSGQIVK